ncbi:pheromone-binding protein-like [Diabrotica undecimpunctata]|uniref:pheromone-binding protein-like n=1 Tax=Diabrotica undecimpunctata TaxID=50387 RepID=UPI003B642AD7
MKYLIAFMFLVAVAAGDRHDDIKAAAKDCSLNKDLFQSEVDKEKLGAAILCVNKKIGLMNEDGSINENVFKSDTKLWNLDDALSQKIFDNCKDLKGDNLKIKAYNLAKCIKETRG